MTSTSCFLWSPSVPSSGDFPEAEPSGLLSLTIQKHTAHDQAVEDQGGSVCSVPSIWSPLSWSDRTPGPKASWGGKGLFSSQITSFEGSQVKLKVGTWLQKLKQRLWWNACFPRLAQSVFLYNPGSPTQGWHLDWVLPRQ